MADFKVYPFPFLRKWIPLRNLPPSIQTGGTGRPDLPPGPLKLLCMRSFFLSPEQYEALKGRYAKFNEPWTTDEVDELRRMAADGLPRPAMAEQLGRSPNAIRMKLQSLGLYVPKPAAKPWTPLDDEALVKQYREGASFAALAATFGRSENAIISRLVRLRAGLLPESVPEGAPCETPEPKMEEPEE